jgi:hypothetical protein
MFLWTGRQVVFFLVMLFIALWRLRILLGRIGIT